jgi:hypothetical protein
MADSNWLSYVGAITGTIGAITGIAGAAMGFVSYRRSGQMKALDLRLELRKVVCDLHDTMQSLPPLLERARRSRTAVAAATGQSGALQQWQGEFDKDLSSVQQLAADAPDLSSTYESMSYSELESELVSVHQVQSKAIRLSEKYRASLAADDKEREHVRADVRSATHAILGKGAQ